MNYARAFYFRNARPNRPLVPYMQVDKCCFHKTGNLPSDDMEFRGVGGLNDGLSLESDMASVPEQTVQILASCHALVFVDNKLVGDPLEKAALKGIDWIYTSDEKAMPKKGAGLAVQIVQRHHFASHLKRMAVVVRIRDEFFAFVKVMITGDQALTACHVANQVHIISKPALILSRVKDGRGLQWISPDESESIPYR
ncbi:hypothetical protein ACLOJK_037748 [Asimina triloba]